MNRNNGNHNRFPGYYRTDKLRTALLEAGFKSPYALAKQMGLSADTTYRVFNGSASHKQVWRIAEFLGVDWATLHDLTVAPGRVHRAIPVRAGRSAR